MKKGSFHTYALQLKKFNSYFTVGFVLSVFAWLMQMSVFWLPIINNDIHYGHGVCIKLSTTKQKNNPVVITAVATDSHPMLSTEHQQHAHHKHIHTAQPPHKAHTKHHLTNNHNHHIHMAQTMATKRDNQDSPLHTAMENCDVCMLLAALTKLAIELPLLTQLHTFIYTKPRHWQYQKQTQLTFYYVLPPSRAPPIFS